MNFEKRNGKKDIYCVITDRIVESIQSGDIPWRRLRKSPIGAFNVATGEPYSLLNQYLLPSEGGFLTYQQATQLGGKIRKGAKSSIAVWYRINHVEEYNKGKSGKLELYSVDVPIFKYYRVFSSSDCDGLGEVTTPTEIFRHNQPTPDWYFFVEDYCKREGINLIVKLECLSPEYNEETDTLTIPSATDRNIVARIFETLISTTRKRLNRTFPCNRWVNAAFRERMVCELGSCYLCNLFGIQPTKYSIAVPEILKEVDEDRKIIVLAANRAERACLYILNEPYKGCEFSDL